MGIELKLNTHFLNLEESATVAINQRVKALRQGGENIVHFGFGQSPFPVHQSIQDQLKKNVHQKAYLPTNGLPELREAISIFLKKYFEYSFNSQNIIIGPGSKQLLYQATAILEGPFILPAPSWVSYGPQAELLGKPVLRISTKKSESYKLKAEALDELCSTLDHKQKILILNSPNNPTGVVYQDDDLKELAQVCRANNVIVLSDEIYAHVNFGRRMEGGIAKYYPEGTLVSGGLSKAFHAGGYRLGFLAAPEGMKDLVQCFAVMSSETFTAVSSPIQYAAVEAFTNPDVVQYARECASIYKATSGYLYRRFKDIGLGCIKPQGAFYLFPDYDKFRESLKKRGIRNSKLLCQALLEEKKLACLPAGAFYCAGDTLATRITSVDFDGESVYAKSKQGVALDDGFVEASCPNLKLGADRIGEFLNSNG